MTFKTLDIPKFREMFGPLLAELREKSVVEQRTTFDAHMEPVPLVEDCTAESLDLSGIPAEKIVYPGAIPGKVLLYLHGGGYVVVSLKSYRHLVSRFAVAAHVTGYRLSPEHPYPAALEDAEGYGVHVRALMAEAWVRRKHPSTAVREVEKVRKSFVPRLVPAAAA